MHILLIHQAFAAINEPGGTRHHELALFLANQGHRVTIIASPISYLTGSAESVEEQHAVQHESVQIIRTYTYSALHKSFVHRVFAFLSFMVSSFIKGMQIRDVDLIWGTSPPIFQGLTAWLLSKIKHRPLLFEIRDLWPAFAVQVGVLSNPILILLSEWLEKFLYRQADHLIVNSPGFIPHIQERGARNATLIPNGADLSMFAPEVDAAQFRAQFDFGNRYVILYAGAHGLSNDLGVVLDAAHELIQREDILFVLLGDGKEKENLQSRAEELRLTNVLFVPPVAKEKMPLVLSAADCCLGILKPIPLYGTVYPNKIFDYMAAGKPIILAMEGVIREVVESAGCGLFVTPGNASELAKAAKDMAENREKAVEMGHKGRIYVAQNFDRRTIAEELRLLMEQIVKGGK